jgi:hypothetical protein
MTIEAGLDFGCGEGTLETNNMTCILIFNPLILKIVGALKNNMNNFLV